jgi:tRNA dimethylallyltransferase
LKERPLVAVVGPTAAGKTGIALRLARAFGGEIVNADPQQFYRGMDIGTAKPTHADRALVPHHLLDIADPSERLGLGLFQRLARDVLGDVWSRGRLPLLVGGSGQYVWGLLEGWTVPAVPPDPGLRAELEKRAEVEGTETLHRELAAVDPEAAAAIHTNNVRRVIRALEVYRRTGRPISSCQARNPLPADSLVLGLELSQLELDQRIAARTEAMVAGGLVGEVNALLAAGWSPDLPALRSIGYREAVQHLCGERTLEETKAAINRATRRLARRQKAWFSHSDARIRWFAADQTQEIEDCVGLHLIE